MKRILITGITGFVGTNLTKYFESNKEFQIFGYSRHPEKNKVLFDKTDFIPNLSPVVLDRYLIDTVIHLGGIAHDLSGNYTREDYLKVNYRWTAEVYDSVQNSKVNNFIFISSIKAVVDHTDQVIDENFNPNPSSDYGVSKRMAEEYLLMNQKLNKKTYILRPCLIHGPGNKGNLNLLYKFVNAGMPYPLAAFENKRSFLSIENFCFLIENILNGKLNSGEFLLADSETISTRDLIQLIADVKNRKVRYLKLPKSMVNLLAKVGSLLKTSFNTTSLTKLVENMEVSNKKILTDLGVALPLSASEGLKKTIRSFDE